MNESWVGRYVARFTPVRSLMVGRVHFIESVIADRAVTYCGRQLKDTTGQGTLAIAIPGTKLCHICARR